jgi:hypothetical protein
MNTDHVVPPTDRTEEVVRRLFTEAEHGVVCDLLARACGTNLPFCEASSARELERVRFAVLTLSGGGVKRLREEIRLAQTDWRDVLVAAGFGHRLEAHREWADRLRA